MLASVSNFIVWAVTIILAAEFLLQLGALYVRLTRRSVSKLWKTFNIRVLTLGDSNTYGLYLDFEHSYPGQLERIWNSTAAEPKIEIMNLGYPGTNSSRLLRNFSDLLSTFRPDIVTIMVGVNDAWTIDESFHLKTLPVSKRVFAAIQRYSRVYRLLYMLLREPLEIDNLNIRSRQSGSRTREKEKKFVPNTPELAKAIASQISKAGVQQDADITYGTKTFKFGFQAGKVENSWPENLARNLRLMSQIAANRGVMIYLLTFPSSEGVYGVVNNIIRQVASESHIALIDIADVFTRALQQRYERDELFFHDQHAKERGNRIVAGVIQKELLKKLQIELPATNADNVG